MSYSSVIPRDDISKLSLLQHLNSQLLNYTVVLEISAEDLARLKTGLDWFDYSLKAQDAMRNYTNSLVTLKRILRDGPKNAKVYLTRSRLQIYQIAGILDLKAILLAP